MTNVIFRIPSKQTPYGYVQVEATPEELGDVSLASDPSALGRVYSAYVLAFQNAERETLKDAQNAASKAAVAVELTPSPKVFVEDPSDLNDDDAEALILDSLGGAVLESKDSEAPYAKPAAPVKKPWETGGPAIKPAAIDW